MAGQPAARLYLCAALAIVAIAFAVAADPTTPQPRNEKMSADIANPPEDSLRHRTHRALGADVVHFFGQKPESMFIATGGDGSSGKPQGKPNNNALRWEAIGAKSTTKKPHPWNTPRKLVDGPVRHAVAETEAPTPKPQEKPNDNELKWEAIGAKSTTKKPHPWNTPRKLVDGRVRRAVAATTEEPTTTGFPFFLPGQTYNPFKIFNSTNSPFPGSWRALHQTFLKSESSTRKATVETTTHDRSIITAPLKTCPEGQRMGPNRNCVDNYTDPEGSD
jgi:hypothetical protein